MVRTINVYTLAELKELHPEGYARVHARWVDTVAESGDIAWSDETMDSLKAVVKACGGKLRDWQIGAHCHCSAKVDVEDSFWIEDESAETGEREVLKDADWFLAEVLKPLGYVDADGNAYFPGLCKFTGFCADDDFMESVWKSLKGGMTFQDALEGLADDAGKMMEANMEQEQDEESMDANWSGLEFTEDGIEV